MAILANLTLRDVCMHDFQTIKVKPSTLYILLLNIPRFACNKPLHVLVNILYFRLAPVGEAFKKMEELYGAQARIGLYEHNDHH